MLLTSGGGLLLSQAFAVIRSSRKRMKILSSGRPVSLPARMDGLVQAASGVWLQNTLQDYLDQADTVAVAITWPQSDPGKTYVYRSPACR